MPLIIVIDEPELGLHPYAIDQLNQMILDAACHAQIVVATQSTAILDGFSADDVTIIERILTQNALSRENYQKMIIVIGWKNMRSAICGTKI